MIVEWTFFWFSSGQYPRPFPKNSEETQDPSFGYDEVIQHGKLSFLSFLARLNNSN